MRVISSNLSFKMAVVLDTVGTLAVEEIGYKFNLHVYDPTLIGVAATMTYVLFRWKNEVTYSIVNSCYFAKDSIFTTASYFCDFTKDVVNDFSDSFYRFTSTLDSWEKSLKYRMVRFKTLRNKNKYRFRSN
jgi:hypothetical protein